jgi:hypothetical protein
VTDVIAAVVSREPDPGALPATTPAAVRRLIARCLRKDFRPYGVAFSEGRRTPWPRVHDRLPR